MNDRYLFLIAIILTILHYGELQKLESHEFEHHDTKTESAGEQLRRLGDLELNSFGANTRSKIQLIKSHISSMVDELHKEEVKLNLLSLNRSSLKKPYLWFIDKDKREKVDKIQLRINNQQRKLDTILDNIEMDWKLLKPLYGLYSKMFVMEALGFIPAIIKLVMDCMASLLELGIISFLFFGPAAGLLVVMLFTRGPEILPLVTGFSSLYVTIYWLFKLPFIMIPYGPTLIDFTTVYLSIVCLVLTFDYLIFCSIFPEIK